MNTSLWSPHNPWCSVSGRKNVNLGFRIKNSPGMYSGHPAPALALWHKEELSQELSERVLLWTAFSRWIPVNIQNIPDAPFLPSEHVFGVVLR